MRYIRKDRRVYHDAHCLLCGSCYGICSGEPRVCRPSTCLACGSVQCSVNGLVRGQCSVCYVGLLTGWPGSDRQCSYKGCTGEAVARVDGQNRARCRMHLERGKWVGYIARHLAERDRAWIEVDDSGPFPRLGERVAQHG